MKNSIRPPHLLPPLPPWVRFVVAAVFVGFFAYVVAAWERVGEAEFDDDIELEKTVAVPTLDDTILAKARDGSPQERLLLEPEPLRHLLQKAIDVGPTVAAALGLPEQPVPIADIRANSPEWRHRWLWFEGKLESLAGPRGGHPLDGYSIYEATVALPDGNHVIAAYSVPPKEALQPGSWVRVEGYLLKLRDTTYPTRIDRAPFLVGRTIQVDYPDWGSVTELDAKVMATVDDSSLWPGDLRYHTVDQDQTEALWHLGAFVRDTTGNRTLADWRKVRTLNAAEAYDDLRYNEIARGTPMRVFGTLIRRQSIAAPANPANIRYWTVAWVQVREFGGHLIPIWVPKRVDELPPRAYLEVRGFYYRWFGYEAEQSGDRIQVPLFVAADLDRFELETDKTMREIGIWLGSIMTAFLVLLIWSQRRQARAAVQHRRDMDARRRHREERRRARQGVV